LCHATGGHSPDLLRPGYNRGSKKRELAMIRAVQWVLKKSPNVLQVLAGLWIASVPLAFVWHSGAVEVHARKTGIPPTGIDAVIRKIHFISIRFEEPVGATLLFVLFLGIGIAITGAIRMVPWLYPRSVKPPAPNPDGPPEVN
jgi:hypothetical protein